MLGAKGIRVEAHPIHCRMVDSAVIGQQSVQGAGAIANHTSPCVRPRLVPTPALLIRNPRCVCIRSSFPSCFMVVALIFSLPPSRNSDPGLHSSRPSSPLTTAVRALEGIFIARKTSALSSLVDSRRTAPLPALRALSGWFHFSYVCNTRNSCYFIPHHIIICSLL